MKQEKYKRKNIINSLLTVMIIVILIVLLRLDIDKSIIWLEQLFK